MKSITLLELCNWLKFHVPGSKYSECIFNLFILYSDLATNIIMYSLLSIQLFLFANGFCYIDFQYDIIIINSKTFQQIQIKCHVTLWFRIRIKRKFCNWRHLHLHLLHSVKWKTSKQFELIKNRRWYTKVQFTF